MSPAARRALVWSLGIVLGSRRAAGAGRLTAVDVQRIITQAVVEAQRVALPVTVAVVDREGNVLGVLRMDGAAAETVLRGRGRGGLDGTFLASRFAAISKAGTAAFFSTRGNAFSTRTAGFIIQSHFPPGVTNTASGPLFGVQFSQLPCGDVNPKLPLGLSADPGGVPLYKGGQAVGGVGVEGNGTYTADVQPSDEDVTREERIAVAATRGFPTPEEIRGDRIYVNGLRLPFRNVEPGGRRRPPPLDLSTIGTFDSPIRDSPEPARRRQRLGGVSGTVLTDAEGHDRFFPPAPGVDPPPAERGLTEGEVRRILAQGARQADRTRAGIRRPIGDRARVNVAVVDRAGNVLGLFSTQDAAIFGIDVSVQKARAAAFFSSPTAAERLLAEGATRAAGPVGDNLSAFVRAAAADGIGLDGRIAFSDRAIGFLSRPFFPDGIDASGPGPFSRPTPDFSVFNDGLEVELVKEVLGEVLVLRNPPTGDCTRVPGLANGIQIFPGSVPLYRGRRLIGAVGVSGDGVDQDDIVAAAGSVGFEAPPDMRADRVTVRGVRLPYVKFPRRPTTR